MKKLAVVLALALGACAGGGGVPGPGSPPLSGIDKVNAALAGYALVLDGTPKLEHP